MHLLLIKGKNITRILEFLYTEVRLKSRPGSKPECFTTETREELLNFSTSCFCFGPQQLLVTVQPQMVFIYVIWPCCSRWQDFLCFHWKLRVYPTLKITVKYNLEKGARLFFFFFFARTEWTEWMKKTEVWVVTTDVFVMLECLQT